MLIRGPTYEDNTRNGPSRQGHRRCSDHRKIVYLDEGEARSQRTRANARPGRGQLFEFYMGSCNWWHLTSNKHSGEQARARLEATGEYQETQASNK